MRSPPILADFTICPRTENPLLSAIGPVQHAGPGPITDGEIPLRHGLVTRISNPVEQSDLHLVSAYEQ